MTQIFIISFAVFAIHYTMQDGEIFGKLGKLFSYLPAKLHDPIYQCPVCMVPYYGSVIYWLILPGHGSIRGWAIIIIAAMGLNVVLMRLFPDKETPTIHEELGEIADAINKKYLDEANQNLTTIIDRYVRTEPFD